METDRLPKGKPKGRRDRGRPQTRWEISLDFLREEGEVF
jgi:hypothetical protein